MFLVLKFFIFNFSQVPISKIQETFHTNIKMINFIFRFILSNHKSKNSLSFKSSFKIKTD